MIEYPLLPPTGCACGCRTRPAGVGGSSRCGSYPTTTAALLGLADWLRCQQIELVAMEPTSDYWKPVFYLLEAEGFACWLLNVQ